MDELVARRLRRAEETEDIVTTNLRRLAVEGPRRRLILVSHDDDTIERVDLMNDLGCRIAEFPITLEAAERAVHHGMSIAMGAPNALRGGSLTGNASALDLLARGLVHILVADYHAPALLAALFRAVDQNLTDLVAGARLLTLNPATAVGLTDRGAIEAGRRADLIVLERHAGIPVVDATLLAGTLRYTAGPFAPALAVLGLPAPARVG
jgi:alpha-D-ribose 1-methylphosphonate 5-triphosphate diphosphatase